MANPDGQILAAGTAAAPLNYVTPGAVVFRLKAVNADFDGSGAGGDYLPAVVLISDGGHVIARAVDQAVKITAGSDAEVSWFPGVKNAAVASSSGSAWLRLSQGFFDTHMAVPALNSVFLSWPNVETSDASVFGVSTTTNPNDTIDFKLPGMYWFGAGVAWTTDTFDRYAQWDLPGRVFDVHGNTGSDASNGPVLYSLGQWWDHDTSLMVPLSTPSSGALRVYNGHLTATQHIDQAWAGVFYVPNAVTPS